MLPFVPMEAIPQDGRLQPRYERKRGSEIGSATYFERGDLLLAKITPCFENGKQAIALELPESFGYATTEVIPLHAADGQQDPRFLFYFLLRPSVRASLTGRMEGSTARQRVPEDALLDLEYPNFPVNEQRIIADALKMVRDAIDVERECDGRYTNLKHAAMRELFTRGLRGQPQRETEVGQIPDSWDLSTVGAHFCAVSGGTPPRSDPRCWSDGTVPWVKSTEVGRGLISATGECITPYGLANSAAKVLPIGAILVAMYGETRGKVGVLAIEASCNQACAALTVSSNAIRPSFLRQWLEYRYEDTRQRAHGGAQQNLNLDIIRNLPIAFPLKSDEQEEVANVLDAIDKKIVLHRRKRVVLGELFKTLLDGLMTGETVVSDLDLLALKGADNRKRTMA